LICHKDKAFKCIFLIPYLQNSNLGIRFSNLYTMPVGSGMQTHFFQLNISVSETKKRDNQGM